MNRNRYLYVRSIGADCWGTCPTATEGGEWLSRKIPGAAFWTNSARTAWPRRPWWIVGPSDPFLGDQNGLIAGREVRTVWRVTEHLSLESLPEYRDCVGRMRPGIVVEPNDPTGVGTTLCYTHNNIVTGLHIPDSGSFIFKGPYRISTTILIFGIDMPKSTLA